MIIILEGVDKTGKTTIANFLSKERNIPIYHPLKPFKPTEVHIRQIEGEYIAITKLIKLIDFDLICDRFHYSQYVYPIIKGHFDQFVNETFCKVDRELKDKAIVFYLFGDEETLTSRIQEEEKDYELDREKLSKYLYHYQEALARSELKSIPIDTTKMSLEKTVKLISQCIDGFK